MEDMLLAIARMMNQAGDSAHGGQVHESIAKLRNNQLILGFCGHFSAGKSTLLNRLGGREILPTGPVPTSANTVLIQSGPPHARIYRNREDTLADLGIDIPLAEAPDYCLSGAEVAHMALSWPIPLLTDRTAIMDTPGVDSTDQAHRQVTEAALHLTDIVFYVTDYNHVLSSLNLQFTKRLTEWGKPVYLLVNQIDKHREEELPFADFRQNVADTFSEWGIPLEGVVYLSLKKPQHPLNEWERMLAILRSLMANSAEWTRYSTGCSLRELIAQHLQVRQEQQSEEIAMLVEQAGEVSEAPTEEAIAERATGLQQQLAASVQRHMQEEAEPERINREWKKTAQAIIDNANLAPAQLRDTAEQVLESQRPGLRVGWLGGAAKREQLRRERLEELAAAFNRNVQAVLEGHVQHIVREAALQTSLPEEQVLELVAGLHTEFQPEWFAERLLPGALPSGEYTLNYSRTLAADAKGIYRRLMTEALDRLLEYQKTAMIQGKARFEDEQEAIKRQLAAVKRLAEIAAEDREYECALRAQLAPLIAAPRIQEQSTEGQPPLDTAAAAGGEQAGVAVEEAVENAVEEAVKAAVKDTVEEQEDRGTSVSLHLHDPLAPAVGQQVGQPADAASDTQARMAACASELRHAAAILRGMPAMEAVAAELLDKAERLAANRYTVALFGAFSAGKSSLANALLGETVLPVSPNPMTAAVSRIAPPDARHPHGTVIVRIKPDAYLLAEVQDSLRALDLPAGEGGWSECLQRIQGLKEQAIAHTAKGHLAFLRAIGKGYAQMADTLGTEIITGLNEFAAYAADESLACFVEWVELRYDCPLTRQGAILVDTPGADSVHARHTNVAFDYIKNADAILYVTYYNHAFSRADREFLLQLGRIKDALELDKMFFVINAADLAANGQELAEVRQHVEKGLLAHGIRQPRLFAVSSRMALAAALTRQAEPLAASGFPALAQALAAFTYGEVAVQAELSVRLLLRRASDALAERLRLAQASGEQKEQEAASVNAKRTELGQLLAKPQSLVLVQQELNNEIDELCFYIRQRFTFRFGELYGACFNAATLRVDDHRETSQMLRAAWLENTALIAYTLSQELLAATLPVERYLTRKLTAYELELRQDIAAGLPGFSAPGLVPASFPAPHIDEHVALSAPDARWLRQMYKNSRSFFEQGGREALKQALEQRMLPEISEYLEQHRLRLRAFYTETLAAAQAEISHKLLQHMEDYTAGLLSALATDVDIPVLAGKLQQMQERLATLSEQSVSS
jgi:small GTP-binding protein